MAGFTHTVVTTYRTGAGTFVSRSNAYTNNAEINIDETVAGSTTDYEIDCAITIANVKSMILDCDQDVTVCTNDDSGGSPQDTIALKAKTPVVWNTDRLEDIPFGGNLTAFYVTNAGESTARFKASFLLDQSP